MLLHNVLLLFLLACTCYLALQRNTAVVFTLNSSAGFFSVFFMMCKVYLYAKSNNYDFYIDHDKWQYTYNNGWHDYFDSLRVWKPENASTCKTIYRFNHDNCHRLPQHSIRSYISVINEIFIVNKTIQNIVKTYINNTIRNDFVSLYVRRGDKTTGSAKEMDTLSMKEIIEKTVINQTIPIFIQTDDYSVIEELKYLMPYTKIYTFTNKEERGSTNANMLTWTPSQRKSQTEIFLASVLVFSNGVQCWSDHRSNVGRFHKLLAYNKTSLYPLINDNEIDTKIDPAHSMSSVKDFYLQIY
jgi:hypothetical protein